MVQIPDQRKAMEDHAMKPVFDQGPQSNEESASNDPLRRAAQPGFNQTAGREGRYQERVNDEVAIVTNRAQRHFRTVRFWAPHCGGRTP